MKNRLILFFELLKQMGIYEADTTLTLDRSYIEDWDESIYYEVKSNEFKQSRKLPNFSVKVIKELIDYFYSEFYRYNDYDIDEYWYLNIFINSKSKEIRFTSDCKIETEIPFNNTYELSDLKEKTKEIEKKLSNDGENIVDMEFYGRWSDGQVTKIFINDKRHDYDSSEELNYWEIVNDLMILETDKYWNDGPGAGGEVRIWGDEIFIEGVIYSEEYEETNLNLIVTPNDFE